MDDDERIRRARFEDSLFYRSACRYRFIYVRKFTSHKQRRVRLRSRFNEPQHAVLYELTARSISNSIEGS